MAVNATTHGADAIPPPPVAKMLQSGVDLVANLNHMMLNLDDLMVSGRPDEIALAAQALEIALRQAGPTFELIAVTIKDLGASTLQTAADSFRLLEQNDNASLIDSLRLALARFAKRSVGASRRAHQLNHGLNAALKTLHELGVQDSGRLIAEA